MESSEAEEYSRYRHSIDSLVELDDPGQRFRAKSWVERAESPLVISTEGAREATWDLLVRGDEGQVLLIEAKQMPGVIAAVRAPMPRDDRVSNAALEARVRMLEQQVAELLAERRPADEEVAPPDPYFDWIEAHREELRAHPGAFVALDPEKGIVYHSIDSHAFEAWIEKLSPEERERLMAFHTSMFV